MAQVAVEKLSVAYARTQVLTKVDLAVDDGEFLVMLGPSGCGKSSLLNAIAGLIEISDGEIRIGGRDVTWEEPKDRGIAMVFQSYALYPRMTAFDNLAFGLRVAGVKREEIRSRVAKAAEMLQITGLLGRRPAALSGGQRQRVAIGRALVRDASVFLLDEPLSNLDAQLRSELRREIKRLHRELGRTMIYVTHDQIEALTLADRIAVMRNGKIEQIAPPDDVYNRPMTSFVAGFLGAPPINFIEGGLESRAGELVFVRGRTTIGLRQYALQRSPSATGSILLGVRPEHITVGEAGAAQEFRFEATVDFVESMGSETIVWCSLEGSALSIRLPADLKMAEGEQFTAGWSSSRVSLFAAETGIRL